MAAVKARLAASGQATGAERQLNIERTAGIPSFTAEGTAAMTTPSLTPTMAVTPADQPKSFAEVVNQGIQDKVKEQRDFMLDPANNLDTQLQLKKGAMVAALLGENLTPEDLRWLSPSEQAAVRAGDKSVIQAALGGLNSIQQTRTERRKEEELRVEKAKSAALAEKTCALNTLKALNDLGISSNMSPEAQTSLETTLGLAPGSIKSMKDGGEFQFISQTENQVGGVFDKTSGVFKPNLVDPVIDFGNETILTQDQNDAIGKLADDFRAQPVTQSYSIIKQNIGTLETAKNTPSAAGDIAMVFSYMKILDPNSTVREGEQAQAQNAAGVPDQVRNMWNKLLSGERLNNAQRQDFYTTAKAIGSQKEKEYVKQVNTIVNRAQASGVDPRYVISDFGDEIVNSLLFNSDGSLRSKKDGSALPYHEAKELANDALELEKRLVPEADIIKMLNEEMGFSNDISMSQNGPIPKEMTKTSSSIGSGTLTGYGSAYWEPGLDYVLAGGKGAPVKMPQDFIVKSVDPASKTGGFGNRVKVQFPDGREAWFSHLDTTSVAPGKRYSAGTVVGTQGNTGNTIKVGKNGTGVHVDITMPKEGGGYYTAEEVARYLNVA